MIQKESRSPRAEHQTALRSLRSKVLALVAVVGLTSFAALGTGAHFLLTTRFQELETRKVQTNLDLLGEVVADQMSIPATKIADWANWDDTFDFATNGGEKYRETNLIPATLQNLKISSLRIYDLSGRKIASIEGSAEGSAEGTQVPEQDFAELLDGVVTDFPNILANPAATEAQKGWVFAAGQLFSFASMPIRRGTGEGDAAGIMNFFKLVDQEFLDRVSERTKFKVEFDPDSGEKRAFLKKSDSRLPLHVEPAKLPGFSETLFVPANGEYVRIAARAKDFNDQNFGYFHAQLPRDIHAEGNRTLKSLLLGAAAMILAMCFALFVALERFVMGRILGLNRSIETINNPSPGSDGPAFDLPGSTQRRRVPLTKIQNRVPVLGHDEVAGLSKAINAMLDNLDENDRSMQEIVTNVQSGFLMVDASGTVLPGHTEFCLQLFERDTITGTALGDLLFGPNRQSHGRQTFDLLLAQIFDDVLPEETSTGLLSLSVRSGNRWIALSARVLRGAKGTVKGVLLTLNDVTAAKDSEHKVEEVEALLQVLRSKEVFGAFIDGLPESLDRLRLYAGIAAQPTPITEPNQAGSKEATRPLDARKLLLTLKGNFAMFGLGEIARTIHQIEDTQTLTLEQIDRIETLCTNYLEEYYELLGLRYGSQREANYSVSGASLEKLNRIAHQSAASMTELRKAIIHFVKVSKLTRIDKALEPIARAGSILATRLGKNVDIKIEPSPLLIDYSSFHGIFEALIHSIRNAIDHGIEAPEQRRNKSPRGRVVLRALRTPDELIIEISDDGRGIDFEQLGAVLENKGICSPERFVALSEPEKLEYLFQGNISTAETVSEISGRGLGLGSLRDEARNMGGDVRIATERGKGTKIAVSIPLRRREARLAA